MLVAQRLIDVHRIFAVDSAHSIGIICILYLVGAARTRVFCRSVAVRDLDLQTSRESITGAMMHAAFITSLIVPMDRLHAWQLLPTYPYVQTCDIGRTRDSVGCVCETPAEEELR